MVSAKCMHNRRKNYCKDCGGTQICSHNKRKDYCKECSNYYCIHNKYKRQCRECEGSSFCKHNKRKSYCKDCEGGQICEHNRQKQVCKECEGSQICEHKKRKQQCMECEGSQICEHKKRKSTCNDCGGSQICEHKKRKSRCKDCNGNELCKMQLCEIIANPKYEGYCLNCFIHLFPDKQNTRNYKTKEKSVIDYIINKYPDFTWITDRKIQDGCSRKRPDLLLDLGYQVIIVEVDENQHESYNCSCENKRLMLLSQDVEHRPIVFIRFNPDEYNTKDGKVTSCWTNNKLGVCTVKKSKEKEWYQRLEVLKNQIAYWINPENKTNKTIEIVELFYDCD